MIDDLGKTQRAKALDAMVVDLVVQIACLALLAYWTVVLLQPLLGIILWSVILAVLLYPAFDWMVRRLGMPRVLAALALTVLSFAVLIGPATWLGLSLVASVRILAERLGSGDIAVPAPPDSVKEWPLLGERLFGIWFLASTNLRAALAQIGPQLKPVGTTLLGYAGSAGIDQAGTADADVEVAEDAAERQVARPELQLLELAVRIAAADQRPHRGADDDVGNDTVLAQRVDDADMGKAARCAATEDETDCGPRPACRNNGLSPDFHDTHFTLILFPAKRPAQHVALPSRPAVLSAKGRTTTS